METVASIIKDIEGPLFALEAMGDETVRGVLDRHFSKVRFNKQLTKNVNRYQVSYVNRTPEYIEFFGSNLLGVHVIRFREVDVLRYYNEVLDIDYESLTADIRKTKTINHTFKVSGDIFNLTLMYMIHRALSEGTMTERDKHLLAYNIALVFFYRATAAIMSAWFTYPADPKIAQAAYENLSYKFLIKKLGTWQKVMFYRANELISKTGTQYTKLVKLRSDLDLVDVINDSANAIKDMLKNYYSEFDRVHSQGDRIGITRTTGFDGEGEEVVRENIRHIDRSIATIKRLLSDPNSFVREDYIQVIADINRNTSPRLLRETLHWVCSHSASKHFKLIDKLVSSIIVYSFYLIETRIEPDRIKDIPYVLVQLKNLYLSSRSTDEDLIEIRKMCDELLISAHKQLSEQLMLATRSAFILYVTFRTMVATKPQ